MCPRLTGSFRYGRGSAGPARDLSAEDEIVAEPVGGAHRDPAAAILATGEAIAASYDAGVLTVRVAGAYAGAAAQRIAITK